MKNALTNEPTLYLSEEKIKSRVLELGQQITRDYAGQDLICVGVLKGSIVFFADLIRAVQLPAEIDFFGASSYGQQTSSSGIVKITLDLSLPITGRHVLLVEDIIDTGTTIEYLLKNLKLRNPASLKLCSLLFKPSRLKATVNIDYLGFEVEDRFIVGYGLDAAEKYRNLPYIATLET